MPDPKPNETEQEFVNRCIPYMMKEGKTQEEAAGACYGIYRNKKSLIENVEKFIGCRNKNNG
jgi:hypothetical protein